jgi:hypothetical protein
VGTGEGNIVGIAVGRGEGCPRGNFDGSGVGVKLGKLVEGKSDGDGVGTTVG